MEGAGKMKAAGGMRAQQVLCRPNMTAPDPLHPLRAASHVSCACGQCMQLTIIVRHLFVPACSSLFALQIHLAPVINPSFPDAMRCAR